MTPPADFYTFISDLLDIAKAFQRGRSGFCQRQIQSKMFLRQQFEVGILGRLLVYARGLRPSSFLAKPETSSPLMLIDKSQTSVAAYDPSKRTPVERVIFDK